MFYIVTVFAASNIWIWIWSAEVQSVIASLLYFDTVFIPLCQMVDRFGAVTYTKKVSILF